MKIHHIILTTLSLLLLSSFTGVPVAKGDFQVDGISYEVKKRRISDDNVVTTDTVTVCAGSYIPESGRLVIPEKIDFGGTVFTVGEIAFHAFEDREELREIQLPPSITYIGGAAFSGCTNLTNINIPDGIEQIGISCFARCKSLRTLSLPASVEKVKSGAFDNSGLRSLTLGAGVGSFNGFEVFMSTDKPMNLDLLTVMAPECRLTDVRSKVVDFEGKRLILASNGFPAKWKCNTQIETLLLPEVDGPFAVWKEGKALPFASKCTVYVSDRLVSEFKKASEWKHFKDIKPISSYKGN